ncbi:hypothetical protein L208DRAFT_405195 [Tricholoma matsutake]|nr:hypothetical protein L208DRAFT_405195 [Tricholoma matsutake 945]
MSANGKVEERVRGPCIVFLVEISFTFLSTTATTMAAAMTTTTTTAITTPPMSTESFLTPPSSPPRTPVEYKPRPANTTPNSDDSSVIDDLSFDYVFDHEGNYVRLSKGSSKSNHSSPPTPPDNIHPDIPSKLSPPNRRSSLSRSESAYATLNVAPSDPAPARSFQRVTSGPALSSHKARTFPRRVTLEDSKPRPMSGTGPSRPPRTNDVSSYPHEKENILSVESDIQEVQASKPSIASRIVPTRTGYSRPLLADTYQRQILPGPSRAGRIMKSIGFGLGLTKSIPESHATGIEDLPSDYETDPGENDPPAPSTTPFPSTDDLQSLVNNGDTEVIEPASIPSSSNQRSYAGPPNSTSTREAAPIKEPALSMSTGTRPRRSASLSDALNLHDTGYGYQYQQQQQQLREQYQGLRSASNGNDNTGGPRRVTLEEREREEREMRAEYKSAISL